jgi:hypothetical protein
MPNKSPPNRVDEYLARAEQARAEAGKATDERVSAELLQLVDFWERMADWEYRRHSRPATNNSN